MDLKGENPDKRKFAWHLYDKPSEQVIEYTYGHILNHIEIKSELANMIVSVGGALNRKYKLKLDDIQEAHIGWHVFKAYLDTGILAISLKRSTTQGGNKKKHSSYHINVKDMKALNSIMDLIDPERVELFPAPIAPKPWVTGEFYHDTGFPMIKRKPHQDAINIIKAGGVDYLIDVLNKLGSTGWRINHFVFDVFKQSKFTQGKSPFKAMKEVDPTKKASLLVEMAAIERLAERNLNNAFYHLYNCDFRGRIYPNTAFLHEQSSDNAKGLLMLDEAVPLGLYGYYWLCVHTANMWGNDKVSLDDRAQWSQDNLEAMFSYVEDPMTNDSWMDADKPFCFLACCYELAMINNWVNSGEAVEDFPSCLPIYIDGSNNGVQHLTAMSKDETVAPLVNLVPQDLPGDVYMYIAEKTIDNVNRDAAALPEKLTKKFPTIWNDIVNLKSGIAKYAQTPKSDLYKQAFQRKRQYVNNNWDSIEKLGPVYWQGVTDKKTWRKTVKRPVMVLGYGGTQRGMQTMIFDDTYDLSPYLRDKEKAWSTYLGNLVYDTCYEELEGPANMLRMFKELANMSNVKEDYVHYRQIVTGFPVYQNYNEPKTKQILLTWGEEKYKINIRLMKQQHLQKRKQTSSTAPNIVHSIDAVHVAMYAKETDYTVSVVHDSFGCHAGNMDKAFMDVRKFFVELYEKEPLEHILGQLDALHLIPEKGKLDVKSVLESDFAFA